MEPNTSIVISEIVAAFGIIGALSVNYYKVKVHHKVLFGDKGELNFVTQLQKDELSKAIDKKITEAKHTECPLHEMLSANHNRIDTQQRLNVQKLETIDEGMKEGHRVREEMNRKLSAICLNVNTLLANQEHIANDVRELKARAA